MIIFKSRQESCIKFSSEPSVKWMDVVNETILSSGKWHGPKLGNNKWENPWLKIGLDENEFPLYILKSFEIATKLAPNISLVFNQNAGEINAISEACEKLKENGARRALVLPSSRF